MSFICEYWETLSMQLLSVVAIGIAIYSSRQTSKDATRQIDKITKLTQQTIENTTQEIESVKSLAKLQIEALAIELDMEMKKYQIQSQRADEERIEMNAIQDNSLDTSREMMMRNFEAEKPLRELKYAAKYIQELRSLSKQLEQLKENLK